MSLRCNNMNMLNMNNMFTMSGCGSNIFGSSMFGGNMFGNSIFGGMFGNMFGGNMFGNGCSLFTNCNGSVNYGAMAGFGVGMTLLNIGGQIWASSRQEKKENSTETIKADVEHFQSQIDNELEKLGSGVTEGSYNNVKPDSKFDKAINDANAKVTECEAELKKLKEPTDPGTNATKEQNAEYNDLLTKYNKDKHELQASLDSANEKLENAKEAKAKEEERLQAIKDKIDDLIDKRNNALDMLNDAKLDKADGSKLQRTSAKKFEGLFGDDGNLKNDVKVSKSDARFAILCYRNASTPDEKKEYAQKFIAIYNALGSAATSDKNLSEAKRIISQNLS